MATSLPGYTVDPVSGVPLIASDGTTVASPDSGSFLSGLAGIFSSVGTAISQTYRAINTPTAPLPPVYNPQTGTYTTFNPQTGQYAVTPVPTTIAGLSPNTLLLIGAAIILIVLLRR